MIFIRRVEKFVDWFYWEPLRRIMPKQVFRYLMNGMINFVITIACYAVAYNFIFGQRNLDLGFVVISPYVAALGISLPINLLIGFWLQKNISFKNSSLKNHKQVMRFVMIGLMAVLMNYPLTKFFVEVCHIYPTVAQIIIYCITAVFSFLMQKHFAFRGADRE